MIFCEKDAASVWCPNSTGVHHLDSFREGKTNCIGAKCAAWRWSDAERGHCGMAGPAAERPIAAAVDPPMRIPRQTTKGSTSAKRG